MAGVLILIQPELKMVIVIRTFILSSLLCTFIHIHAETNACDEIRLNYDKYYYFDIAYQFLQVDISLIPTGSSALMPGYSKFKVIKPENEKYVIKFIDTLEDQLFIADKSIFNCNAKEVSKRYFSFSVTTLPIKIRAFPDAFFDWEINKNLGVGIGYYAPWEGNENLSIGVLLNAGTSGIQIDSFSTMGYTNDIINTDVLTISLGICFLFSRNFQLGIMGGYDMISTRYENLNWVYDRCPWFGFGMGYSFVNILEQKI